MVNALEIWNCPDCYQCPHSYKERSSPLYASSQSNCGTMKVLLKDELHAIQLVIRVTVENAVQDVLDAVKSYADATRETQKKVIGEVAKPV